ncbi:atypical chemokine receptor 1 [Podarcis raffonei]|uniref:atypical chemokine receptor 1 n=1 Tax=Podarcis raffonei TaxID=65483 RepID=UPI0023299ABB|nr:atypical chemokine receptor 1 [Podarcis raffonei]
MGNCVNMDRSPSHVLESADFADLLATWTEYYPYEDTTLADSALPAPCYSTFCSSVGGIIPTFLVVAGTLGILGSLALAIALVMCFRLWEQTGLILTTLSTALFATILPFFAAGISWGWTFGNGLCQAAQAMKYGCQFAQGLLVAACVCPTPKAALPGCLFPLVLWVTGFLLAIPVAVIHGTGKDGEAICALRQAPELLWWSLTHIIFWIAVFYILPAGVALAKVALKWERAGWHPPAVVTWLFYLLWAPYGVALILDKLLQMNLLTHTCSLQEHLSYFLGLSEGLGVLHCILCPFLVLGMVIRHRRAAQ